MNAPLDHRQIRRLRRRPILFGAVAAMVSVGLALGAVYALQSSHERSLALKASANPATAQAARHQARQVLRRSPLDAVMMRVAALPANGGRGDLQTNRQMTAAGELSWRDPVLNAWLFDSAMAAGDYKRAIDRADALLRTEPELREKLVPIMVSLSQAGPEAEEAMATRLSFRPVWRPAFMDVLDRTAPPAATYSVLTRLARSKGPPEAGEISAYVNRLVRGERYEEAYLATVLFMPADELKYFSNLFNGDFDKVAGIRPFDWTLGGSSGLSVSIEDALDGRNPGLHVIFDGTSTGVAASQLLLLPAGPYRFAGEIQSAQAADQTLEWTLSCPDGRKVLSGPIAAKETMGPFSRDFQVPANCLAQVLALTASPTDTRKAVDVWYDKIRIERHEG